jgi:hypothetical protein
MVISIFSPDPEAKKTESLGCGAAKTQFLQFSELLQMQIYTRAPASHMAHPGGLLPAKPAAL